MNVLYQTVLFCISVWKKGYPVKHVSPLWLDDAVGALMDHLEGTKGMEDTIIFYFSDHCIDIKASLYERDNTRLPFIAWDPVSFKQNRRVVSQSARRT